ncbi:hypothetical protein [Piscirickettsia litoralis]|nr:hypothetical protein [Piscirickettsia litoralis]
MTKYVEKKIFLTESQGASWLTVDDMVCSTPLKASFWGVEKIKK